MDVGQSPIQFIDQPGSSRTPNAYYYGNNSVPQQQQGALSSRLHQLRPAGSVPFSSRTAGTSGGTLPRQQKQQYGDMEAAMLGYQPQLSQQQVGSWKEPYRGDVNQPQQMSGKSLSSQNLAHMNQIAAATFRGATDGGQGLLSAVNFSAGDRPRPSSARDPSWMMYDSVSRGPKPGSQGQAGARFRQHRSSSFDQQERERMGVDLAYAVPPHPQDTAYLLPELGEAGLGAPYSSYSVQRDLARLQQELDLAKDKLASSLNSIKTFWSPELKRERALRKDENSKYVLLAEELHQLHMEKKSMLSNIHQLETELRREKELRSKHSQTAQELDLLYRRCEELEKENRILAKQADESDKRAQFQKESLATAEENIRKLLEVVKATKSGNPSALQGLKLDRFEETQLEMERLRSQLQEYSHRTMDLDRSLVDRDFELARTKEQLDILSQDHQSLRQENESIRQDIQQTQTLQSLVETKESKILTLENEIRLLEDELARMRDEELITPTASVNGAMDEFEKALRNPGLTMRPHDRLVKSKMETMNLEISKRDSEIYSLQSRLEMAEKQHQDQNHHINVLKEQVKTREHKISMLMADVISGSCTSVTLSMIVVVTLCCCVYHSIYFRWYYFKYAFLTIRSKKYVENQ